MNRIHVFAAYLTVAIGSVTLGTMVWKMSAYIATSTEQQAQYVEQLDTLHKDVVFLKTRYMETARMMSLWAKDGVRLAYLDEEYIVLALPKRYKPSLVKVPMVE